MTSVSNVRSSVGLRWVQMFALNTYGSPLATGTAAYEGVQIEGAKALTLNVPEFRRITHVGDDGIVAVDILPATETASGELTTGKINDIVDSLVTGNKSFAIGDGEGMGMLLGTDTQNDPPQVGILAFHRGLDTRKGSSTYGKRVYQWYCVPRAWVVPRAGSMNDNPAETTYAVYPAIVGSHLWESAFTLAIEGAIEGQMLRGVTEGMPKLSAFLGDNTVAAFPLSAPCRSASKVVVWVNGVNQTSGVTKATNSVTFETPPTTNARIQVLVEQAGAPA